jgi:type III secretory pathway component EscS
MNKLKLFLFVILFTILVASIFGIIHDQVTYTIAPEYYTKFKFFQFRLAYPGCEFTMNHRVAALIVGIQATWWMGLIIGLFYAITLMTFEYDPSLFRLFFKTVLITFIMTILGSISGYIYWKSYLQFHEVNWFLPENLTDRNSFIGAGSIHNFSYLGGVLGLMAGMLYLMIIKQKLKKK